MHARDMLLHSVVHQDKHKGQQKRIYTQDIFILCDNAHVKVDNQKGQYNNIQVTTNH